MKTMRELVEAKFVEDFKFLNSAWLKYDNPQPIPDTSLMTDEELWSEYLSISSTGPIG